MKFLIVLCAVVAVAVALPKPDGDDKDAAKQKYKENIKLCIEETGTTDEVAKKLKHGDFTVRDEPAQCFVKCYFEKLGFVNEKNEFLPEFIVEKIKDKVEVKDATIEDVINQCIKEKGENDCETAFKVFECYRGKVEYSKKHCEEKDVKEN